MSLQLQKPFLPSLLFVVLLLAPLVPHADAAGANPLTPELLESMIKEAEAKTGLEEKVKADLISAYRSTLRELESAKGFEAAAKEFSESRSTVLKDTEVLRKAVAAPMEAVTEKSLGVGKKTTLTELEQLLVKEQADRLLVQTKLADLDNQLQQESNRPAKAHQRMTEVRRNLETVASEQSSIAATAEGPLPEARKGLLQMRQRSLKAELQALDQELVTQPTRLELLQLQRDQTARGLAYASERVFVLKNLIDQQRQLEAERAKADAEAVKQGVAGKHPLLQGLADENAALSAEISDESARLAEFNSRIDEAKAQFKEFEADFKGARQKLEITGVGGALGRVLVEQRRRLPNEHLFRHDTSERESLTGILGLRQIRQGEERRRLGDISGVVERMLAEVPAEESKSLGGELRNLLLSKRELLDKSIALGNSQLRSLLELDFAERQLLDLIKTYDDFLAQNLLWIRSSESVGLTSLALLPQEIKALFSPSNWSTLLTTVGQSFTRSPAVILGLLLLLVMQWATPRLRQLTAGYIGLPREPAPIDNTLRAMGLLLLRVLPWPLLLWLLGQAMESLGGGHALTRESGRYLQVLGSALFNLRLFWMLCEPGGLGERHFHWSTRNTTILRRQLYRLMWSLFPSAFLAMVASTGLGLEAQVLSRFGFVGMLVSLGYFFFQLFHPVRGVVSSLLVSCPESLIYRSRYAWHSLSVLLPLILASMALSGYFYTAGVLTRSLFNSMLLILALIVVYAAVTRWVLLRLHLARVSVRAQKVETQDEPSEVVGGARLESMVLDLNDLDLQSRKLLNTAIQLSLVVGLWIIWSSVLPAFGVLNDVSLWQREVTVGGQLQQIPVTLADLGLAVVLVIITAVAARSLPSVVEILLLQQLAINAGNRYAYSTLIRYLVVGIGATVVFSIIGGSWSEIQWLVAALGVGIGFGLQEIVANFISGLIILFERPIRVGDVVTVGGNSGVVSRIRIRATTITNWDRQELLVPNKEFITGQLLNWSLSDSVTRITIDVGVEYGSDVKRALLLLEEAANEHPIVLKDPPPVISFDNFGDNSLNLKLRCFLPNLDNRVMTLSDLHVAINDKFNAAGIVVAFPQQDVHLNTSGPLEVRVSYPNGNGQ